MKRLKKPLKVIGLICLALGLAIAGMNWWVYRAGSGKIFTAAQDVPAHRVAMVLGTSQYLAGGTPNAYFTYRMNAVEELFRAGRIQKVIVSGDNGTEGYNETDAMRRELIRRGIPETAIVNDHAGFRTLDSVVRVQSVFEQEKFIVISQEFHVRRALFIAHAHGLDATGYVARNPRSTASTRKVLLREVGARVKAFLDCYLLGTSPKFDGPPEPIQF